MGNVKGLIPHPKSIMATAFGVVFGLALWDLWKLGKFPKFGG